MRHFRVKTGEGGGKKKKKRKREENKYKKKILEDPVSGDTEHFRISINLGVFHYPIPVGDAYLRLEINGFLCSTRDTGGKGETIRNKGDKLSKTRSRSNIKTSI